MIDLEKAEKERTEKFFNAKIRLLGVPDLPDLIVLACILAIFAIIVIGSFVDENKENQVKEETIVELLGYKYFQVDGIDYETSLITSIDYNTEFSNNNFIITYDDGKAIIRFRADEFTSHN